MQKDWKRARDLNQETTEKVKKLIQIALSQVFNNAPLYSSYAKVALDG